MSMQLRALNLAAIVGAAGLLAACSSSAMPAGRAPVSESVLRSAAFALHPAGTAVIPMNEKLKRATVHPWGHVWAYAGDPTQTVSQVVHLAVGQSVVFEDTDALHKHTAALLGTASATSAPWPSAFDGGTVASPAGTDIATPGWNTGSINPGGGQSATYVAATAGYYMIGCKYHYQYGMRTLVIVQ